MLDPVGPLPPAVYWRRRAVTIVALVAAVALILWVVSRIATAEPGSAPAAASSSESNSAAAASAGASSDSGGATGSDEPQASDESEAGAGTSAAATEPSATEAPAPATSAPPASQAPAEAPATPAPPGACAPESIKVTVSANANEFAYGSKPKLILSVQNVSAAPCYRDLNAAGQELTVWDGAGTRLWSSNDCYPETSNDTRLIDPAQKIDYSIVWSGKVSEPTCTAPRPLLGPGQYFLQASQDGIVSERVPFTIV
ncbi:hypothetical protein EK0264_12595 [Epidermidibacterium keratini]|uniref:MucR family transcriptional regulator n=1 Tax=Epidermidibacterium keratini TaxID=1891644 RepID=A0A7L4YP40_9ACTN|nr:hypothetical protein [Epidermidibacterium keratini]QHC01045.1 hypothetical protein EK0264_12595 [Epidermidibacterium keratini]